MSTHVKISVLVPAYNEEELIRALLDSVKESFAELGRGDYEIIVCDNNSNDATAERARKGGARVVFESHNQIARARNAAAAVARGKWLIFIDADSRLTCELLRRTLENLDSGRICGGGVRVRMDGGRQPWPIRFGLWLWNTASVRLKVAAGAYVYCLYEAWSESGGFDERYYAGEEIAFSRRLKRWGRLRGLRFAVITDCELPTSPRKAEQFTLFQMMAQVLLCCIPGSLRRRERCGFWYRRPAGGGSGRASEPREQKERGSS